MRPPDRSSFWVALAGSGFLVAGVLYALEKILSTNHGKRRRRKGPVRKGYAALIGNTPLIELPSLSEETGCRMLVKVEYANPGGTSKDRIAIRMVEEAEASGRLKPGGTIVEGTSGSTGIALASLARSRGYHCIIVMPDDQAQEKVKLLQQFGASVKLVQPAAIANPNHYVNVARAVAQETPGAVFMDQFESSANFNAHYYETGPEIYDQLRDMNVNLDAFVMSAGTGGTLAGVSTYLKEQNPYVKVVLVDPPGSSLYNKVKHGVCYTSQQKERGLRKHRYDTIAEGIGLDRITKNFELALIDEAWKVTDQEALDMAHYLLSREGIFVGSSTAMNLVGLVRTARMLGPGHTLLTFLCDSGQRHLTRFWNRDFAEKNFGLVWPESDNRTLKFLT